MQSQPRKLRKIEGVHCQAPPTGTVLEAANAYIVSHYPFGCLGGTPRRLVLENLHLWIVPIFLTSPGVGPVGEVGVIAVDDLTTQVIGGTERQEVAEAICGLKERKRDDLEAAFLRARTV